MVAPVLERVPEVMEEIVVITPGEVVIQEGVATQEDMLLQVDLVIWGGSTKILIGTIQ